MFTFDHNLVAAKDSRRIPVLRSPLATSAGYQGVKKSAYYAASPIASFLNLRYLPT